MKLKTLGVGMVGFGFIGKIHSHAHRSLPLFFDPMPVATRLVGVCTTRPESGEKAIRQAGFEFSTTNISEHLNCPDIDVIHICSPNFAHKEAVLAALAAGKHIYCDKPLALNLAEAEEICSVALNVPTVQQMTFNYRFVPALMRARQLAVSGYLGQLFQFRVAYLHAGYIDNKRPYTWRTDKARSGGGALVDLGAHAIDITRFLLGKGTNVQGGGEFNSICAELRTMIPERSDSHGAAHKVDVDDIALLLCRLAGGASGTVEATRLATGVQDELRVELHGSKGALKFNLMEPNWLQAYDATVPEAVLGGDRGFKQIECVTRYPAPYSLGVTKNTIGWPSFHIHSLFDFITNIAAIENGESVSKHSPTFEDGLAAQRVIDAAIRSADNHSSWENV